MKPVAQLAVAVATEDYWGQIPIRSSAFELANKASPNRALTPITRCPASPVASNWAAKLGSDPDSGHSVRAGQRGPTELGSDPYLAGRAPSDALSAVASNCVAVAERNVFVFIFGPTLSPRPFPPRRAGKGANTIFGRVYKQRKYTRHSTLFGIAKLGSDPNSGQGLRACQRGLLGSDPNNPTPNNPKAHFDASAMSPQFFSQKKPSF